MTIDDIEDEDGGRFSPVAELSERGGFVDLGTCLGTQSTYLLSTKNRQIQVSGWVDTYY